MPNIRLLRGRADGPSIWRARLRPFPPRMCRFAGQAGSLDHLPPALVGGAIASLAAGQGVATVPGCLVAVAEPVHGDQDVCHQRERYQPGAFPARAAACAPGWWRGWPVITVCAGIERLDARLKAMKAELKAAVLATGSRLMDIHGIGPAGAARILADVGDVARFPTRNHFASWTGTAPIDASSGTHIRHRLSRAGNRRINHALYMAGIVQLRTDTTGRRYYRHRLADGKTPMEAMRRLRCRLSDVVYRQLAADLAIRAPEWAGPGGHSGATLESSAADLTPVIGYSDKPLPGPVVPTLPRSR
jgi:Transposase IS116/IS110/IS902 family